MEYLRKYKRDQLPPLLYLQLDNTASDNKNHHVLEFCSFLVENGYFEEVLISTSKHFLQLWLLSRCDIGFMMVAIHMTILTRCFSRFSTKLAAVLNCVLCASIHGSFEIWI